MARFECKKCGSLVVAETGSKTATCTICGKKQSVPTELLDDKPIIRKGEYNPQWDHYEKLVYRARKYRDLQILRETAEEFDRLGDYESSREMAEFCRKRIAEEEVRRADEAQSRKAMDAHNAKARRIYHIRMGIINLLVVVVAAGATIVFNKYRENKAYEEAVAVMERGDYDLAIDLFKRMKNREDSDEWIARCEAGITESKYAQAVEAMDKGLYGTALPLFEELTGYKDSDELAVECQYMSALDFYQKEKYEWALKRFESLPGYKDSDKLATECLALLLETNYNEAVALMSEGEYSSAYTILQELDGYKDSEELAKECEYQKGLHYMSVEKYNWALREFEKILDYKDAAELAAQAKAKLGE